MLERFSYLYWWTEGSACCCLIRFEGPHRVHRSLDQFQVSLCRKQKSLTKAGCVRCCDIFAVPHLSELK